MKKTIPAEASLVPEGAAKVFDGVLFEAYQWQQSLFDGGSTTFEMLRRDDTAVAICVVDGKLVVLQDEQPHHGMTVSFPGGRVDDDDSDIMRAAQREVHEETGYSFAHWKLIEVRQPELKIEWFVHVYVAWGVTGQDEPHVDGGEKITVELLSFDEVLELSRSKQGYIGEALDLLELAGSADGLTALPEFQGEEVDR